MALEMIQLKLVIDKEKNRVVFAESDNHFVDTLLSFLTVPIGALVRLTNKKSNVGCMDALYESIVKLDSKFLEAESVKDMLLRPRSAAEDMTKDLKLSVDVSEGIRLTTNFLCPSSECSARINCLISSAQDTRCRCGQPMTLPMTTVEVLRSRCGSQPMNEESTVTDNGDYGVFVKESSSSFMVADDLQVDPVSSTSFLSLLNKLGITDMSVLEEKTVNVTPREALLLLNQSLISTTALTDVFLKKQHAPSDLKLNPMGIAQTVKQNDADSSTKMNLKLLVRKSNNEFLYAEVTEDFLDLLFSFLAFPIGSIQRMLDSSTPLGCLQNLYQSVEDLSIGGHIKSEKCRARLLDLGLAPHYLCENQLLQLVGEDSWEATTITKCSFCFNTRRTKCGHLLGEVGLKWVNPKLNNGETKRGGRFLKGPNTAYMVTDGLDVKPLSFTSSISFLNSFHVPISDFEERAVSVGKEEALALLKASLFSKTVFSDAFSLRKRERFGPKTLSARRFDLYLHPCEGSTILVSTIGKRSAELTLRIQNVINYVIKNIGLEKPLDSGNSDGTFVSALAGGQTPLPMVGDGSFRSGLKPWQKPKPSIEILCNNQVLSPEMTLAIVRAHIWKKPEDLVLNYRVF